MGSKTGTGDRGSTNDVGIFWPAGRPPIVVVTYLTESARDRSGTQWDHRRSRATRDVLDDVRRRA